MRQVFIKEFSCFTPIGLADRLDLDASCAYECVADLMSRGVLKFRADNKRGEYEIDDGGDIAGKYQFVYVGLVIYKGTVIVVYPKYMDEEGLANDIINPDTRMKIQQIFRVLRKYGGSYSDIAAISEEGMRANDRIALMLTLLEMYGEYGVYSNYVRTLRQNGYGEISWERTVAMHQPYISRNEPIYFDYETVESTCDTSDYITRLHRCVLTACSKFMQESGIAEFLALDEVELSDDELEDFGDLGQVNYRLDGERGVQFVTWKQDVIDLLKRFVNDDEPVVQTDEVVCLGTSSFYHVWETACKVGFNDLLGKPVGKIGIKLSDTWRSCGHETLLNIMPRPQWTHFVLEDGTEREVGCGVVDTLIPDTVSIWNSADGRRLFGIFDAKYYVPNLGDKVKGQPGVESVTKQILYQRAYRDFITAHEFDKVVNVFLVPSDEKAFVRMGHVAFPGVFDVPEMPFADGVDMWKVPAERIWLSLLKGKPLPDDILARVYG